MKCQVYTGEHSTLAIFYMQKQQIMPPFAAFANNATPAPAIKTMTLLALFRGFFEFVAARPNSNLRGLSVTQAQEYRAPAPVGAEHSGASSAPLYLEDPAEFHETRQQRNLAETLGEQQWAKIVEEAKKAADRLAARPQRWFHWAEILDPRVVPVDQIKKLQPLAEVVAEMSQKQDGEEQA